jgi:hypothetical protein
LRNDYFAANDWFNNYLNVKEPTLRQNDFGGTLGGPLSIPHVYNGKDKTFFFVSYEGLRASAPQAATLTSFVPDLCLRGVASACPSDGSVTPAAPVLQPVMKAFPLPTPGTGQDFGGFAPFFGSWSNPNSLDSGSVRFDHIVKDRARLFFRFSETGSSSQDRSTGSFSPTTAQLTETTTRTYTGGSSILFSNRLSNDLRLNYSTNQTPTIDVISPFAGSSPVDLAQLSGLPPGGSASVVLCCNGVDILFQQAVTGGQRQWNLADTSTLSLGRHQFKFGADYRRLTPTFLRPSTAISYNYFSAPQDLATNISDITSVQAEGPAYPLYQNFSAFGLDEWKVTSRLSLSIGLRWEVNPPPGVTQGLKPYTAVGVSDLNTTYAAPQGTPLYRTAWFNFAPRLGAAYVIHGTTGWETVLRAGGGVFFDTGNQNDSAGFFSVGFNSSNNLSGNSFPINAPSFVLPTDQPCQNTAANPNQCPKYSLTAFYPHLQLPYTWQWNASVEQALGKAQALSVMFVGSHASRLIQHEGVDVPSQNLSLNGLELMRNGLTSDYESLQAQFTRRLSGGLTSMASYTFSHCIDYGSFNFGGIAQRGNCDFDVRHNFSAALSYDLPNVGHNGLIGALADHWGIDNRFTARTSFPIDLNGNNRHLPNGQSYDQGLDIVPGVPVYLYGADCAQQLGSNSLTTPELLPGHACPGGKALNPNAFENVQCPATNQFCIGNAPRYFARLFGAWQMDLAVRREFPVYENLKLQFRAEAFNVFNHPNFGAVDGYCFGNPGAPPCFGLTGRFGTAESSLANSLGILNPLYQMGGPRSMQFALKLIF